VELKLVILLEYARREILSRITVTLVAETGGSVSFIPKPCIGHDLGLLPSTSRPHNMSS